MRPRVFHSLSLPNMIYMFMMARWRISHRFAPKYSLIVRRLYFFFTQTAPSYLQIRAVFLYDHFEPGRVKVFMRLECVQNLIVFHLIRQIYQSNWSQAQCLPGSCLSSRTRCLPARTLWMSKSRFFGVDNLEEFGQRKPALLVAEI